MEKVWNFDDLHREDAAPAYIHRIKGHEVKLRGELRADRFKDKEPDLVEIEQEHELIGPAVDLGDAAMAIEILNEQ